MSNIPLHTLDPLTRFSDRAADYVKYRPTYPSAAIDTILSGLDSSITVADVGAGTGISARLLGDRGLKVWAIEPNQAMSDAAEPHPHVSYCQATAENTGLPARSMDLVASFQAFHWFEPDTTLNEFHRILKPLGRVALVWNQKDLSDAFTCGYHDSVKQASNGDPVLERLVAAQPLFAHSRFRNAHKFVFPSEQALDLEGLCGASNSRSYVPRTGSAYEKHMKDLQALYQRYTGSDGLVYMKYNTQVILAEATV